MISFDFAEFPDRFEAIYNSIENEYSESGVFFLTEKYIRELNSKTSAFPLTVNELISGALSVREDENAAKYALFVSRAMEDRSLFCENLQLFTFPDDKFPFLSLLCFLPFVERIYDTLKGKGLPDDIVSATVGQFEDCIFLYEERFSHLGFNKRYFDHMQRYVDLRILNIGRLRFELYRLKDACMVESRKSGEQTVFICDGEMNSVGLYTDTPPTSENCAAFPAFFKETETEFIGTPADQNGRCLKEPLRLSKSEYFLRVPPGADCIAVHIPAKGALTKEACEESYRRARVVFKKLYPDCDLKAFRCHSWMMAPELSEILRPDSNLLAFNAPYIKYPSHTKGEDVLNFVFKMKFTSYDDLPEDTSLQRALKKIYLSGGYLYEYCGIFAI